MEKKKRRWGDRKDGVLLRDLDGMHFITPLIYPNRCDNEAYIRETIDLTNMNAYLKKKNETETEFPYTMFHLIVAALGKFLVWILTRLDIHGWIPASIIETDPYYTTCVISNLGSIKLNCGYHHLTNWGTCSVFCIIGEKSKRPVYHEDGTIEMREMLDLGLTIDERLADGYYYSKTIRLLKTLLENPELLETPANQEVAY